MFEYFVVGLGWGLFVCLFLFFFCTWVWGVNGCWIYSCTDFLLSFTCHISKFYFTLSTYSVSQTGKKKVFSRVCSIYLPVIGMDVRVVTSSSRIEDPGIQQLVSALIQIEDGHGLGGIVDRTDGLASGHGGLDGAAGAGEREHGLGVVGANKAETDGGRQHGLAVVEQEDVANVVDGEQAGGTAHDAPGDGQVSATGLAAPHGPRIGLHPAIPAVLPAAKCPP